MTTDHCQKLKMINREIVHRRPRFFSLKQNKTGHAFIDTLHTTFSTLLDRSQDALLIVMVMTHLAPRDEKQFTEPDANATAGNLAERTVRRSERKPCNYL